MACVLDEFDFWRLQGIVVLGNLKVQLHESISVDGIGSNDVGVELEQVIVFEYDKVVGRLLLTACLLELLALMGHSFGGEW